MSSNHNIKGIAVEIDAVNKVYESRKRERVHALESVTMNIEPGEFVTVVGPSGCGKSTLLMLVAGLLPKTSGSVFVDGQMVDRPHPEVGIVFQQDVLLEWRSVMDNVLLPIEIKRLKVDDYRSRARELLWQVGLRGFEEKYPSELSGGMRQRVSLCRALLVDPGLLLMDEPFGALDALTRDQMNIDLQNIWSSLGNSVLFITHSIDEAIFLSDRVAVMSPRPGKISRTVEVPFERPRTDHLRTSHEFTQLVKEIRQEFETIGVLRAGEPSSAELGYEEG